MNNIENQEVVWKPYPKYPFIEANQFGQVRIRDRYVGGEVEVDDFVRGTF